MRKRYITNIVRACMCMHVYMRVHLPACTVHYMTRLINLIHKVIFICYNIITDNTPRHMCPPHVRIYTYIQCHVCVL